MFEEPGVNSYKLMNIATAIVVASCATTDEYDGVLRSWAGAQEIELLRSWGRPTQSYEANGHKFIVYESHRNLQVPGSLGTGSAGGGSARDVELACTTTFELDESKVFSWSYRGNDCNRKKATPVRS